MSCSAAAATSTNSYELMERHERLGYVTLALSLLLMGWRLCRRHPLHSAGRVLQ